MALLGDIASEADVSKATVSRVLNNKPGVLPETRDKVWEAMRSLGHDLPERASLRTGLLAVVLPEQAEPYFNDLAHQVFSHAGRAGLAITVVPTSSSGPNAEPRAVQLVLDQGAVGAIFVGGSYSTAGRSRSHFDPLRQAGLPTVLVNCVAPELDDFARVVADDASAAAQAWRHLRDLGHERIGLVLGSPDHVPTQRELRAFRDLAQGDGLPLASEMVKHTDHQLETAQQVAAELLRDGATALVAGSDLMAVGALRAARRAGLRMPQDVSIVTHSHDFASMALAEPALTAVRQPIGRMAEAAVMALQQLLAGRPAAPLERVYEPVLVVRGSTGPRP